MATRNRLLGASLALMLACGGETGVEDVLESTPSVEIGGRYEVTGVTIGLNDGAQRPIHGTVNVIVEDGTYKANFELSTTFPGSDAVAASVIGTGDGTAAGGVLEGTANTQLVAATVPGVDVGFAFVPREVGRRIVSSSRAEFLPDGSVQIEIENQPREGEDYAPTRTQLVGFRSEG